MQQAGIALLCSGELVAKDLQKFALAGFPATVPRVDEASLQPFLGLEPRVGTRRSEGSAMCPTLGCINLVYVVWTICSRTCVQFCPDEHGSA